MACMGMRRRNQTKEQRAVEVKAVVKKLEAELSAKRVTVVVSPEGAVAFQGWKLTDRDDVTDACAYLALQAQGSWALQQAVAAAEARAGRKVSGAAVMGGSHSHDGGKTWHPGH